MSIYFFILSVISKTTCHIEVIPYVDTFCIIIVYYYDFNGH